MHSINTLLNKTLALKPTHVVLMHNMNDLSQLLRYEDAYWQENDTYMKGRTLIIDKDQNLSVKQILKKSFLIQKLRFLKTKFINNNNLITENHT